MHRLSARARACGQDGSNQLDSSLTEALSCMLHHLRDAPPLKLSLTSGRILFVLTNGSFEPEGDVVAGVGGVIFDEFGSLLHSFSGEVPEEVLQFFMRSSNHPMYEVELYTLC